MKIVNRNYHKNFSTYGFSIFPNKISKTSSNNLFQTLNFFCNFFCPKVFNKKYKDKWLDKEFSNHLIYLRKENKNVFAAIYNSVARSSILYNFCYENNLHTLAARILNTNINFLGIRDPILRMDVPFDKRNIYGWHQDSAYTDLHVNPKNELVFWIPLIKTTKKNGTLLVKLKSHYQKENVSVLKKKGSGLSSRQLNIKEKYLKKFKTKSLKVDENSAVVTYGNLFHKSGYNSSNKVRFTYIVRFNKIISKDFLHFRKNLKHIKSIK